MMSALIFTIASLISAAFIAVGIGIAVHDIRDEHVITTEHIGSILTGIVCTLLTWFVAAFVNDATRGHHFGTWFFLVLIVSTLVLAFAGMWLAHKERLIKSFGHPKKENHDC